MNLYDGSGVALFHSSYCSSYNNFEPRKQPAGSNQRTWERPDKCAMATNLASCFEGSLQTTMKSLDLFKHLLDEPCSLKGFFGNHWETNAGMN